jgi:hypothetical protein
MINTKKSILNNLNKYSSIFRVRALATSTKSTPAETNETKDIGSFDGRSKQNVSSYAYESFPYTRTLFRKNYLKYTKQSFISVQHDYVYDKYERLPTLEERLKDYEDPLDKRSSVSIGYLPSKKKQAQYKEDSNEKYLSNRKNPQLEKDSYDFKCNFST